MIPTTFNVSGSQPLVTMPYLHEREIDGVLDAIDSGELIAVADLATGGNGVGYGAIVALARPDLADKLTDRDDDAVEELNKELQEARKELDSLRTIIGEVFAEKEPADYRYRLENAADDVMKELDYAITTAGEM